MYRNYEYNSEPLAQGSGQPLAPQRRRPKRPSFFQRAVALVLCAALFGGVAGGSFYGVNRLLGSLEADSSDSGSSLTSSVSLTSLSYSSGDSSLAYIGGFCNQYFLTGSAELLRSVRTE